MADPDYIWLIAEKVDLDPDIQEIMLEAIQNVDEEDGTDAGLLFQDSEGHDLQLGADDAEEDTAAADNEDDIEMTDLDDQYAIYTVHKNKLRQLQWYFTPDTKVYLVPDYKVEPIDRLTDSHPVMEILNNLKLDPKIIFAIDSLNIKNFKKDVTYLTGEDKNSPLRTRHSFTEDAIKAAEWLKERFEEFGAKCELKKFLTGFSPNVVCAYLGKSKPDDIVILGAHYDSRGTFGRVRAPGADDDGSGSSMLLSIARAIHELGISFDRTVMIIAHAGEEQGLFGSRALASEFKTEKKNIIFMIQGDMLAYRKPGEPMQVGFPNAHDTKEATWLAGNISSMYVPELVTGITTACCSDHQSYYENGFASTQFFERGGPIADPEYHSSGDLSDRPGYDFEQLLGISKAMYATILEVAGFSISASQAKTSHSEL